MKRFLLLSTLTLLLVILIGSTAFATLARIRSLGNADYFFKDISQIYRNPAWLGMYTNTVYAELGSYDAYYYMDGTQDWYDPEDQVLGINYKVYKGLSLGLTLNRVEWLDWEDIFYDFEDFPTPINEYDILASYDFEKLHLGLGFYHAGYKWTGEYRYEDSLSSYWSEDNWEGSVGTTILSGGFVYDLNQSHQIEGMVRLIMDRAKEEDDYITSSGYYYNWLGESKGGNGIEFGARGFFTVQEDFQVIPLFMFGTEKIGLKASESEPGYDTTYETGDVKMSFFTLALGGNLKLDKGMVAGGLNITQYKYTDELDEGYPYEYKDTFVPGFNLGVEYWVTSWLVARLGMEKEFGHGEYKSEDLVGPYKYFYNYKYRWTTYYEDFLGVGVGFKFSKFMVDASLHSENSLFEGGYLMSGQERNLFGIVSATFEF